MTNPTIRVDGLSKAYQIRHTQTRVYYRTLREDLIALARKPIRRGEGSRETFWALNDVSFEVKHGEALGVIGRNGAGKSTLLKILSRITRPTKGTATVYGRVGSLLEVGTGFHSELTGRENIYLNGAILGMTKRDIQRHFDEIVAFAEVEQFLDTPVKRYSSGMHMRLAFAVAAHLEPEVLVVDEVLAVGDAEFQKKCLGKMSEVAHGGRTVLFVSHNMNAVRELCDRVLLLSHGVVKAIGTSDDVISLYAASDATGSQWVPDSPNRLANNYFTPTKFSVVDKDLEPISSHVSNDSGFGVLIEGDCHSPDRSLTIGFAVYSSTGDLLFWSYQTDVSEEAWPRLIQGPNRLLAWVPPHLLNEGDYRIEFISSLHFQEWLCQPGVNAPSLIVSIRGGLSHSPHWLMVRPGLLGPILPFKALPADTANEIG